MAKTVENVIYEGFELAKNNYVEFLVQYLLFTALFAVIIILGVILLLVMGLLGGISTGSLGGTVVPIIFVALMVIAAIFLVQPLWVGSYYAIALRLVRVEKISVLESIRQAQRKYVPLLWTMALETLIFVVVDAVIFLPLLLPAKNLLMAASASGFTSSAVLHQFLLLIGVGIFAIIAFSIATLILAPLLYEAVPLVMLEDVGGVAAIKESVGMGRKNFWNIIWLLAVFGIALFVISFVQGLATAIFGLFGAVGASLGGLAVALLVGAFVNAWLYVLPVIFYKDFVRA